jgi:hypothetical protein
MWRCGNISTSRGACRERCWPAQVTPLYVLYSSALKSRPSQGCGHSESATLPASAAGDRTLILSRHLFNRIRWHPVRAPPDKLFNIFMASTRIKLILRTFYRGNQCETFKLQFIIVQILWGALLPEVLTCLRKAIQLLEQIDTQ